MFIIHLHFFFGRSIPTGYYAEDGMKMTAPVSKNNFTLSLLNSLLIFFFLFSLHFSIEGRSVRFCLKGYCFRVVIDLDLSLMGSITHSVKAFFYMLYNNRILRYCTVCRGITNTSILKGG